MINKIINTEILLNPFNWVSIPAIIALTIMGVVVVQSHITANSPTIVDDMKGF